MGNFTEDVKRDLEESDLPKEELLSKLWVSAFSKLVSELPPDVVSGMYVMLTGGDLRDSLRMEIKQGRVNAEAISSLEKVFDILVEESA